MPPEAAAAKARATADRMQAVAETARGKDWHDAAAAVLGSRDEEALARDRYQESERAGRPDASTAQLRNLPAMGDG